jgi:two-component system NtrC family sensor kinase
MKPKAWFNKTNHQRLARRMFTLIILVSFLPLILVTGLVIERFQSVYKTAVHEDLEALVGKHASVIDDFLKEKRNMLRFLSHMATYELLSDNDYLRNCLNLLQRAYGPAFEDLSLIDETGIQTAYAGPFDLLQAEYAEAGWFKEAMRHTVYTSNVFTGYREYPHFVVTVKINIQGRDYLLRATIRFETFSAVIENVKIGKTGSAFIVDSAGRFQTQPDQRSFENKTAFTNFAQRIQQADPAKDIADVISAAAGKRLCVTALIKEGEWTLVYLQDPSDAFHELIRTQKTAVLIFLLGGMCIILMAFYLPVRLIWNVADNGRDDAE